MSSRLPALLLCIGWCISSSADDVSDWLMKINDAEKGLNYEGIFVYVHGNEVETMRVVHRGGGEVQQERLYSLNGAPREIIRDAEQVWCYAPERRMGMHEYRQVRKQGFPHILPQQLNKLRENYDISLGRRDRIADRPAQRLSVIPRDDFRYGYDLWADLETGLLLKAALLDSQSQPVEQYVFVELKLSEHIHEAALSPRTPKQDLVWLQSGHRSDRHAAKEPAQASWTIGRMPDGFVLSRHMRRMFPMRKRMIEHYVYSDGLAAVSVFIEQFAESDRQPVRGLNRMGAVHAFSNVVDAHQITVVGEVPAKTVSAIGMSVTPNGKSDLQK